MICERTDWHMYLTFVPISAGDIIVMILLIALITVVAFAITYAVLDNSLSSRLRILRPANEAEVFERKNLSSRKVICLSIIAAAACGIGCYRILFGTSDIIHISKLIIAMLCIAGSCFMDYKERRIPNIFPLVMAVSNIALLAIGYFTSQDGAISYIVSAVFSTVCIVIFLAIASFLTHEGIGIGDIKLFGALALVGDIYLLCTVLIIAMLSCSLAGIYLLLRKKKTVKDGVPFAPFVFIGFLISVYFGLY